MERRKACCPLPFPPPRAGEGKGGGSAAARKAAEVTEQRLTAFRFLSFFRSFVGMQSLIVMAPVIHRRRDLTKVGF